jgi:hypothetical protein
MRSRGRAANEEPNDSIMIANDFVAAFLRYCIYLFLGFVLRQNSVRPVFSITSLICSPLVAVM